jgi:hypothetical protein
MDQEKHNQEGVGEAKEVQTIYALRTDEALRVLANHQENQTWSVVEEKKLLRKIDFRLMPILWFT